MKVKINDYPGAFAELSLAAIAQLSKLAKMSEIPPDSTPEIIGVEAASNDPAKPSAFVYTMQLRGSFRTRLSVKVKESTPSITTEELEKLGGEVKAVVTGFRCGFLQSSQGSGYIFYASAESIKPVQPVGGAK